MRLKKLSAALAIIAALGAAAASSASAAVVTEDAQWYTGTAPGTLLSGSTVLNASLSGKATFSTTIAGTAVVIEATGVECVGCIIENSGGTAVGSGKLKWTGVTVEEPVGCTVPSTITTSALTFKADYMIKTTDYMLFEPTAGATTTFMSYLISGPCGLNGTTLVHKGTLFGQFAQVTGVQATSQTVDFSGTINSTAGGTTHVGTETATLQASIEFSLSSGVAFGTH